MAVTELARKPDRAASAAVGTVAGAYSVAGAAWQGGPGRIYDRLAVELVARCPGGVDGRRVLDLGAGTGAATRAARAAGATEVVAVDFALGMLAGWAEDRPAAVVGDALGLPFAPGTFGAIVAAFSINHLTDPARGLAEAARVLVPGGGLIVSAYAEDDAHPVKAAVEAALAAHGWELEPWYATLRRDAIPRLATAERASAAAAAAGLGGAVVEQVQVGFPELTPPDLVAWRLGMSQTAAFVADLDPAARASATADALSRLGDDPPMLVRSIIVVSWAAPR